MLSTLGEYAPKPGTFKDLLNRDKGTKFAGLKRNEGSLIIKIIKDYQDACVSFNISYALALSAIDTPAFCSTSPGGRAAQEAIAKMKHKIMTEHRVPEPDEPHPEAATEKETKANTAYYKMYHKQVARYSRKILSMIYREMVRHCCSNDSESQIEAIYNSTEPQGSLESLQRMASRIENAYAERDLLSELKNDNALNCEIIMGPPPHANPKYYDEATAAPVAGQEPITIPCLDYAPEDPYRRVRLRKLDERSSNS